MTRIVTTDAHAYLAAVREAELAKLSASAGGRNTTLFKVAARLYQSCAAGYWPEETITHQLTIAAAALGLPHTEIRATLRSASRRAAAHPVDLLVSRRDTDDATCWSEMELQHTPPAPCEPPSAAWLARAERVLDAAQRVLWSTQDERAQRALAWLHDVRGLSYATIVSADLGYIPVERWEDRAAWGLAPELNEWRHAKRVWLPRGIVIPWRIDEVLWKLEIRRPLTKAQVAAQAQKIPQVAGSANALYDADQVLPGCVAVLVEGVLNALTIRQAAGDLAVPVATGSTAGARRVRWLAKLALCRRVLIAYDNDPAGEQASGYWLDALGPMARRWRPWWGDANEMAQNGGDVRAWIQAALEEE